MVSYPRLDRHTLAVLTLIGIVLVLHFVIINLPERECVFDECYYVPQARALLSGSKIPLWHPPLGVCLIAVGMALFGDRALGWRFSSVVFGVLSIWVLYLLARRSTGNKSIALLSTTLYAFDSLTFVQGSIAMLDVFFVFFMLLGFLFYWRNNRLLAFVMMALSTLCKLVGVAGFGVLVVMTLIDHEKLKVLLKRVVVYVLCVVLPFWGFLLMQGHLVDPFSELLKMALGSVSLGPGENPRASLPWDWVINPKPIPYYVANIPRRYWIRYRAVGNPMILLLTLPSVFGLIYDYVRHRRKLSLFVLVWFVMVYFLPWYPMALLSLRPLFLFYFLPAVGAVTVSISVGFVGISRLLSQRLSKISMYLYVTAVLAFFILEFPIGF